MAEMLLAACSIGTASHVQQKVLVVLMIAGRKALGWIRDLGSRLASTTAIIAR